MENHINYSELRQNLKSVLDSVCDNHETVLITRKNGGDVVILSREDYESLDETAYLLQSPVNRKRLTTALKDIAKGAIKPKTLIQP